MPISSTLQVPVVYVVDDDDSVRRSLECLIESAGWRAETFGSAREFLSRPQAVTAPSCLVLDVVLPDLNGCEVQSQLAGRAELPVIFISGHGDVPTTVRAMKGGAVEFFTKPFAGDVVLEAMRNALDCSSAALADVAQMQVFRDRHSSLSPREREVMALVVSGRLNKQMGFELGISEITVKAHRGQVMRKMKAGSLCDLVRMAIRLCVGPGGGRPAQPRRRCLPPRAGGH
ncbi:MULTISPECIES: response regulator [unclassified Variovorax]|uniref:response regulator transcription factor n=1 Tax=unclassified Variovorax TaxID=663243 RepID=UPI0008394073|nr:MULTISPECIES: response regulator [unclassified Variovorax]PNG47252.1 Response regulator protein TmoT [Variovorax sp. B2]PNG48097.1 Response regulator protein TmoT [Variovorax sp. B4]VTV15137.1 Transcriptional regulatory protein FixJ [Variovorax sp. WDL1]